MCGISGYISKFLEEDINSKIIGMLENLEYRGYDSVGISIINDGKLYIWKDIGKISELKNQLLRTKIPGKIGIGHTRWATHGGVTKTNAHPHTDCNNEIALVHNGIIENFLELKKFVLERGHKLKSETDTEIIAHLIEEFYKETGDIYSAFRLAIKKLKGSFAIVMITTLDPNKMFFARFYSPLVIGISDERYFVASDVLAFLSYTNKVIFLEDGDFGYLSPNDGVFIENLRINGPVSRSVNKVPWSFEAAMKGGYPHYMIKEIYEQPEAIKAAASSPKEYIREFVDLILNSESVYLVAAGTSYHAALVGEKILRENGIKAQAIISSEFIDRVKNLQENDLIIGISQSGETADTLTAIRYALNRKVRVGAITNVVGSAITRLADKVIYMNAGPEIGVAATKTYIAQLTSLLLIGYELENVLGEDVSWEINFLKNNLPQIVSKIIKENDGVTKELSQEIKDINDSLFIAAPKDIPTAMEGALKLKEISYIHAEWKSIDDFTFESKLKPVKNYLLVLVGDGLDGFIDENRKLLQGNKVLHLGRKTISDPLIRNITIEPDIPKAQEYIAYIPPLQLLAYHTSVAKGLDPDKPRNLAKSVTVE